MGPRSHERGNNPDPTIAVRPTKALQWGRVLMNAETWEHGEGLIRYSFLLQWGRVLMNAETSICPPIREGLRVVLQWGRVLMNAETFL